MQWKDLAPELTRQRLIIEATTEELVGPELINKYLIALAKVTEMDILSGPYTYSAHELGFGGWIHWRTSGCHVYTYPANTCFHENKTGTLPLLTVDTYTCKPFSIEKAVQFTKEFFSPVEIVWKEVVV